MPNTDPPDEYWTEYADRAYEEWRASEGADTVAVYGVELPPTTSLGAASLMRVHTNVRPPVDVDELEQPDETLADGTAVWTAPRAPGKAIPPQCLRVLSSPLPPERGGGCINNFGTLCPGTQRDGGCLAEIVKKAIAQGKDWKFEIVREVDVDPPDPPEGRWVYRGAPLDE